MKSALMFPIYLATNKIYNDKKTYQKAEELGSKRGQIEGPTKTREAKLTHGNLQISKYLCIIIRSCNKYKC